jgi:hypothetical protein
MRFTIDGNPFDLGDIGDLTQHDTLAMARAGMGLQTWARTMGQIARLAPSPDGEGVVVLSDAELKANPDAAEPDLFFDSPRHLLAFVIATWLARRKGGQPALTFEESARMPWASFEILPDEDDDEPEDETPDPTPLPGSAPDAGSA